MPRIDTLDLADYALPADVSARLLSPALVIYLDRVRDNLRTVLIHTGGPERWRPHIKTTKLPEIFAELARAGIRHFKCATTRELDQLLTSLEAEGIADSDVLLAYPVVGPAINDLESIAAHHPEAHISVLCEDLETVGALSERIGVFVDVNPGMHRTGIPLTERDTILKVAKAAGPHFRGVHFYDGHLHEDLSQRRAEAFACYDELLTLLDELVASGLSVLEVITSGTPTFRIALDHPGLSNLEATQHRVSPGTVVFHDQRSESENADLDLYPAALLFTRVVSRPSEGLVTCDAGAKSLSADAGDPAAVVLGRPGLVARPPSEEHLPLQVLHGAIPQRGDELLLVPRHVCTTVNLAEEVLLVENGRSLGTARVTARSHPLLASWKEREISKASQGQRLTPNGSTPRAGASGRGPV